MRILSRILTTAAIALMGAVSVQAQAIKPEHPDMAKIKTESTNPKSKYYYPRLLKMFMSNDTVMTTEDYKYFYYGTMFQEDYNPYRPYAFSDELKRTQPLYFKQENLTRAERSQIETLAKKSLEDNPLDLSQLMYRVYVYEKNQKFNLPKSGSTSWTACCSPSPTPERARTRSTHGWWPTPRTSSSSSTSRAAASRTASSCLPTMRS